MDIVERFFADAAIGVIPGLLIYLYAYRHSLLQSGAIGFVVAVFSGAFGGVYYALLACAAFWLILVFEANPAPGWLSPRGSTCWCGISTSAPGARRGGAQL